MVGYYLLLVLGRGGPLVEWLDVHLLFTWGAAIIASEIVGLPLMVGAEHVRQSPRSIPRWRTPHVTLGSSEPEVLWRVAFPLARRGILAGLVLGTGAALGEFGATLMIAGNIPGRTQTLPLAIYDAVQNRQYGQANAMVALMTVLAFLSLWAVRKFENPARITGRR